MSEVDLLARLVEHGERGVRRVAVEVLGEQVSFTRREAGVQVVCTCGAQDCEHERTALRFFGDELDGRSGAGEPEPAGYLAPPSKPRASSRPPAIGAPPDLMGLAEAIAELCLATARAGVEAHDSPSIRAALEQLTHSAPQPISLSLARFIGRLQDALAAREVAEVARLLAGAQSWAAELARGLRTPEAVARRRVWLGAAEEEAPASLTDVTLVEVGREWLNGLTRNAIERRYLVDVVSGELYSEERRRGEQDISVGPCPRVVQVAFGELDSATVPQRARLLQYTVAPEPSEAHWERLATLGETRLPELLARFAEGARRCPALSEPVLLFAPRELSPGGAGTLRDASGSALALRDDQEVPLADGLRELAGDGDIVWVAGRLRGLSAGPSLRPISLLVRKASKLRLWRVT